MAALLAVALVAGVVAVTSQRRAKQEAAAAEQQAKAADARRLGAEALRSNDIDRALLLAVAGTNSTTPPTPEQPRRGAGPHTAAPGLTRSDSGVSVSISPEGAPLPRPVCSAGSGSSTAPPWRSLRPTAASRSKVASATDELFAPSILLQGAPRERRSNQRLRAGLAAVAVLLAVAIVAGALAKTAADRADQEATRAEQQTLVADARRLGAEALRSAAPDLALLLAVAGTRLDDSPDTRNNLSRRARPRA